MLTPHLRVSSYVRAVCVSFCLSHRDHPASEWSSAGWEREREREEREGGREESGSEGKRAEREKREKREKKREREREREEREETVYVLPSSKCHHACYDTQRWTVCE
jgi:hypothetical protein